MDLIKIISGLFESFRKDREIVLEVNSGKDADKQIAIKNQQSSVTSESQASVKASNQWHHFFSIVSLDESAQSAMMAFVGDWPVGLDPDIFSSLDISVLLSRIQEYQKMPYPLRSPFFPTQDSIPRPDYKMVDGKIACASTLIDMLLLEVVPANIKLKNVEMEPGQVVMELIEHYSGSPLARLIFTLPFIYSASEAISNGNAVVIVIEDALTQDALTQVYKGVENLLFDVYSDLQEGEVLSDMAIQRKLESFLSPVD